MSGRLKKKWLANIRYDCTKMGITVYDDSQLAMHGHMDC